MDRPDFEKYSTTVIIGHMPRKGFIDIEYAHKAFDEWLSDKEMVYTCGRCGLWNRYDMPDWEDGKLCPNCLDPIIASYRIVDHKEVKFE